MSYLKLGMTGSSPYGALVPVDVPSVYPLLSYQRPWCVVPCLWDKWR